MAPYAIIFILGVLFILILGGIIFYVTYRVFSPKLPEQSEVCGPGKSCPEGSFCSASGFCLTEGKCLVNADCGNGDVCVGQSCVPLLCRENRDCGPLGYCDKILSPCPENEQERPPCSLGNCKSKCFSDADCAGSSGCVKGVCTQRACLTQADCFFNEACTISSPVIGSIVDPKLPSPATSGTCVPALGNCTTDLQCVGGTFCSASGRCVQCTQDSQCSGNNVCINGLCLHPDQEGCSSGKSRFATCSGTNCTYYPVCCTSACGANCKQSNTCPSSCPYCVGGKCLCQRPPQVTPSCSSSKPCKQGQFCINGQCITEKGRYGDRCVNNVDCLEGLFCRSGLTNSPICAPIN